MMNELEKKKLDMLQKPTQQSAATTSRDISIEREKTVASIQNLAMEMKITAGKVSSLTPLLYLLTKASFPSLIDKQD